MHNGLCKLLQLSIEAAYLARQSYHKIDFSIANHLDFGAEVAIVNCESSTAKVIVEMLLRTLPGMLFL